MPQTSLDISSERVDELPILLEFGKKRKQKEKLVEGSHEEGTSLVAIDRSRPLCLPNPRATT